MSSNRERNDPKRKNAKNLKPFAARSGHEGRKPVDKERGPKPHQGSHHASPPRPRVNEDGWLWGFHAVESALSNPDRPGPLRLFLSEDRAETFVQPKRSDVKLTILNSRDIGNMLPKDAVHQGIALHGPVPEGIDFDTLIEKGDGVILILDQVTDPQNIGAIFRSCAAFGVNGLIFQDRHSPPIQGVLVKTAAGAADKVPFVRATNLSRALEKLSDAGYVSVGLAGDTENNLHTLLTQQDWGQSFKKLVLVLGSEGDGLRRLVAEHCDHLARIPMPGGFESLNVSHAASISLYEALGRN